MDQQWFFSVPEIESNQKLIDGGECLYLKHD
jgi:hypothetical protein